MIPPRVSIVVGTLVVLLALALPAAGRSWISAATGVPTPSPDATDVSSTAASPPPMRPGVMGSGLRASRQLATAGAAAAVCSSANPLQGIDVSQWQATVDWGQVARSGRSFAYARAAHAENGTINGDPTFQANFTGIKQAGMKAGAYLFFDPSQDPTAQAKVLISALNQAGFAPGDLAPVFDVEVTGGQSGQNIATNLQTAIGVVRGNLGVNPVIYTGKYFWDTYVGSTSFGANLLWIANWNVSCPSIPNGWTSWALWQYSDNANVPGVSGAVDADESCGAALPVYYRSGTTAGPGAGQYRVFLPLVYSQC